MLALSLNQRIWLTVIAAMIPVIIGIAALSTWHSKTHLETQLSTQNADAAEAFASALSSISGAGAELEQQVNKQFDLGHYQLIRVEDGAGNVMYQRQRPISIGAPEALTGVLSLDVTPGQALILGEWSSLKRVIVEADPSFASSLLWANILRIILFCSGAIVILGLGGIALLKIQTRGLRPLVEHAEAIANRQFDTRPLPPIAEYRPLAEALNLLADKVRIILQQDARKLEKWNLESQTDKITGLMNREPFLGTLKEQLKRQSPEQTGVLALVRMMDLASLNRSQGRVVMDNLIREMGLALRRLTLRMGGWSAGRLNGSDFAILCPNTDDIEFTAQQIHETMLTVVVQQGLEEVIRMPGAACGVAKKDTIGSLLTCLDASLAEHEADPNPRMTLTETSEEQGPSANETLAQWRSILDRAFAEKLFYLGDFPVVDAEGDFVHIEAPVRIGIDEQEFTAGDFLPWISRLNLSQNLDKVVIELALEKIKVTGRDVCINFSFSALTDAAFAEWLVNRLTEEDMWATKLWVEFQETVVFRHLDAFKSLSKALSGTEVKLGVEHAGYQIAQMGKLNRLGVDYLKIDGAFVRGINENPANQKLVKSLVELLEALNVRVFSEGVSSIDEWKTLVRTGVNGFTGPAVTNIIAPTPSKDAETPANEPVAQEKAPIEFQNS
jgi:EAL domain-containing protein (putative c-di-GMP-specific phosphodiesterase class I)/GGDEF domain-containing protein